MFSQTLRLLCVYKLIANNWKGLKCFSFSLLVTWSKKQGWLIVGATRVLEKSDDTTYCNRKMAFAGVSWEPASNCSHSSISLFWDSVWEFTRGLIKYLQSDTSLVWFLAFRIAAAERRGVATWGTGSSQAHLRRRVALIHLCVCSRLGSWAAQDKPPHLLFINHYLYCLLQTFGARRCLWTAFSGPCWPGFH